MPDLRKPGLTRPILIALVLVIAGILAMTVALLSGSSSPSGDAASSKDKAIGPLAPIDPEDEGKTIDGDEIAPIDPFAGSFGTSGRRKVTVSVSGNGYVGIKLYYRDRKKPRTLTASNFSETRTVEGRFPLAAIVIQVPGTFHGAASRATCRIVVSGTEVSQESATKPWEVRVLSGLTRPRETEV